jgi:hypothetical protein
MGIGSMIRWTGRVAVFAAMAALLLQASCTISLESRANVEAAFTADTGCHDSTPSAPDSGHICCNGEHAPEALLSAAVVPTLLTAVGLVRNPIFDSGVHSLHAAEIALPVSSPPGPLALRI